jgi:DNA-binding transcriptional ArsR family regulator
MERITVEVTPRFEIFYALQALESGTGERLSSWRRETERRIPARARTEIARVAPSPLMWPLLADSLREQQASLSFVQMISALNAMDDPAFQRSVLGGVFKADGAVDGLMSGRVSLKRTVVSEAKTQERLLKLLGLHPFDSAGASAHALERIVSHPAEYRSEMMNALEMFWQVGFGETWETLAPQMMTAARELKRAIRRNGFAAVVVERKLPAAVTAETTQAVHLIPSAFNVARLWAAYKDSHEQTTFYIPVLESSLGVGAERSPYRQSPRAESIPIDPALVFKALGDTTRYAIATTLARSPMTSAELAKLFKVSKPTISHHVAQLRAANLLQEQQAENGIILSLDRRVLENASDAAADDMFSAGGPDHVVKRSRRRKK